MSHIKFPGSTIERATVSSVDNNGDFPIGKVKLGFKKDGQTLPIYYFKGLKAEEVLKAGDEIENIVILSLKIPKDFYSVDIKISERPKLDNGIVDKITTGQGVSMTDFLTFNDLAKRQQLLNDIHAIDSLSSNFNHTEEQIKDKLDKLELENIISGLFLMAFNQSGNQLFDLDQDDRLNDYADTYNIKLPSLVGNLAIDFDRAYQNNFDVGRFADLSVSIGPNPIGYSGSHECPWFFSASYSKGSNYMKMMDTGKSVNRVFFKFRNHYFIPMALSNGNTFYFAFENEKTLKYFIYKINYSLEENFDIAAYAPIYSENILGISICKDIRIVKKGNPVQDFW